MSDIVGKYLGPLFVQEAPSGAINGVNSTFTLSQVPAANAAVKLFLDGVEQAQGTQYTLVGQTITMATPPTTGQDLQAAYMKA